MKILPRGNGFQVIGTLDRKRIRKNFKTREEAVLFLAQIESEVRETDTTGTFGHMFKLACGMRDAWMRDDCKPKANAKLVLDAGALWGLKVNDVQVDDLIELFEGFKASGNGAATINRKKSSINVLYGIARELGYTDKSFSYLKQSSNLESGRTRVFAPEELSLIYKGCDELGYDMLRDICRAMQTTGLRPTELYDCFANQKCLRAGKLSVATAKRGQPRVITLVPIMEEAIRKVFAYKNLYNKRLLNARWATLRNYLGFSDDPEFVLYAFRHTCASTLVNANVQLEKVRIFMGHKHIQTTMKYVHIDDSQTSECGKALQNLWG
jgi:site-specific recombinase XerD